MSLEEITELPVGDVTAANAHLYLWVPNALLPEGLEVMQAWGFRYVSNIIWAKRRKDGGPDGRGVGFYFRNVTEPILFGVKGSMRTLAPWWFRARIRKVLPLHQGMSTLVNDVGTAH